MTKGTKSILVDIEGHAKGIGKLTDAQVKRARPGPTAYKLRDGEGLYLFVSPTGAKTWRVDCKLPGKNYPSPYSIGSPSEFDISSARAEAMRARDLAKRGINPTLQKKAQATRVASTQISFRELSVEWMRGQERAVSRRHWKATQRLLDRFLLPTLGSMRISDIESVHVLEALRTAEKIEAHDLLSKSRIIAGQIMRHAIATARRTDDPVLALTKAFTRPPVINRATVKTPQEMKALFKALHEVPSEMSTKLALYFQIATCVRPGEARFATWGEIDLDAKVWRISAERMKMRVDFVQPLSSLAVAILEMAKALRQTMKPDELLFPGFTRKGHLSENAFTALLARASYYGRQSAHGFRAMFRTWAAQLEDETFDPTAVELCLAHRSGDAYNRHEYLSQRRKILARWADHLIACGLRLPN